jgi:hypothetical protein
MIQMDLNLGRSLADSGAQIAAANAGSEWSASAYSILVEYARTNKEFMTEDVRAYALKQYELPLPPDSRAWGGVVNRAVKAGLIKRIGYAPMKSVNCHANPKSVWKFIELEDR